MIESMSSNKSNFSSHSGTNNDKRQSGRRKKKSLFSQKAVDELFQNKSSSSQVFQSAFPAPEPPKAQHVLFDSSPNNKIGKSKNGGQQPFYNGSLNYRTNGTNRSYLDSNSGLTFRDADSTQRALFDLERKRYEAMERRRAIGLLLFLVGIALTVHFATNSTSSVSPSFFGLRSKEYAANAANILLSDGSSATSGLTVVSTNADGAIVTDEKDASNQEGGGASNNDSGNGENDEDALEDIVIEPGKEYLEPLRYFADVSSTVRSSDTPYFFHVPRSGGQTIKEIVGECLGMVQASEVGVRDGHGQDPSLQIVEVKNAKYVNVDTTTADGLKRAATLGLAESKMAQMITSSYLKESGALFDLYHQGRAFILLREPVERAVSMYHYRTQGEDAVLDSSITIEDYAQGNGIENNWMTRFIVNKMEGELSKEHLEQAKEILKRKFLIGFLDDAKETVARIIKYYNWSYDEDETKQMNQEDCIDNLIKEGTNHNPTGYEMPKKGSQAYALITWQTQYDKKLFEYARELFLEQTKKWGTHERKKELKKKKKGGK